MREIIRIAAPWCLAMLVGSTLGAVHAPFCVVVLAMVPLVPLCLWWTFIRPLHDRSDGEDR